MSWSESAYLYYESFCYAIYCLKTKQYLKCEYGIRTYTTKAKAQQDLREFIKVHKGKFTKDNFLIAHVMQIVEDLEPR